MLNRFRASPISRTLHPGAWWLWALGLAVIATRTTNLIVFGLLVVVVTAVVLARRGSTPWAMSFRLYAVVALVIVVLRVVFRIVFAAGGSTVLFNLPQLRVLSFTLFGPVSAEAIVGGVQTGAQIGVMVLCVGAANALASPKRLMAAAPGALHEFGTVAVVTVSAFPQLAESVRRVSRARLLRNGAGRRRGALAQVVMPVLADALDRSLCLAGAMDSRGYGRRLALPDRIRWAANGLLLLAFVALGVGLFGLIGGVQLAGWMILVGVVAAIWSLRLVGRRAIRSRYRPDRWGAMEWLVALCGLVPAGLVVWLSIGDAPLLYPSAIAMIVAVAPAVFAPRAGGSR